MLSMLWRVTPFLAIPVLFYNVFAMGGNREPTVMEDGTPVAPLLDTL